MTPLLALMIAVGVLLTLWLAMVGFVALILRSEPPSCDCRACTDPEGEALAARREKALAGQSVWS